MTKEKRLSIGKEIYDRKLNRFDAAIKYNINEYTARDYLRLYKASLRRKNMKKYEVIIKTKEKNQITYIVDAVDEKDAKFRAYEMLDEEYRFYLNPVSSTINEIK